MRWWSIVGPGGLAATLVACAPTQTATPSTTPPLAEPTAVRTPAPAPEPDPAPAPATTVAKQTPAPAPDPSGPLTAAQRDRFFDSPEDSAPEHRGGVTYARRDKHYLAGNEKTLQAFVPAIADIGGGYMGVGSDQAYLLLGWAKPQYAWFVDYDPDIVALHRVYRAFFLAAKDPDEFVALWHKDGRERGKQILAAAYEGEQLVRLRRLYLQGRGWIHRRLVAVRKRLGAAGVASYLGDQSSYEYVQTMLRNDRVRPMVADLTADRGIKGVAQAARDLGVPIRVLYLSNAEEYWKRYSTQFRANVAALPFDDRSIVLRTMLIWGVNQDYRYVTQTAANFVQWLEAAYVRNVYDVAHGRPEPDPKVINEFRVTGLPAESPAARRAQKSAN